MFSELAAHLELDRRLALLAAEGLLVRKEHHVARLHEQLGVRIDDHLVQHDDPVF